MGEYFLHLKLNKFYLLEISQISVLWEKMSKTCQKMTILQARFAKLMLISQNNTKRMTKKMYFMTFIFDLSGDQLFFPPCFI